MYWIRLGSAPDLLLAGLCCALWLAGGWLLAGGVFRLRALERLAGGVALGLALFIVLAGLAARALPFAAACWAAAGGIFAVGVWQVRGIGGGEKPNPPAPFPKREGGALRLRGIALGEKPIPLAPLRVPKWAKHEGGEESARMAGARVAGARMASARMAGVWWVMGALVGLTVLFALIGRGLGIFDDEVHLPLVSSMAADGLRAGGFSNTGSGAAGGNGLHVLAAFLVRVGGLLPWGAWDLSKAFTLALTGVLAWVWLRRATRSGMAAWLGAALLGLAGGTRWALLLLPPGWLDWLSGGVTLNAAAGSAGASLAEAMTRPWPLQGDGPLPFPFAFHNGVFAGGPMLLDAPAALPYVIVLLLVLLAAQRRYTWPASLLMGLVLAALARSGMGIFMFVWLGIALAVLTPLAVTRRGRGFFWPRGAWRPQGRERRVVGHWVATLLVFGLAAVLPGGFFTGGLAALGGAPGALTLAFRQPPALASAHLGTLALLDPRQLIVALAELGPALLAAPLVSARAARWIRRRGVLPAGLALAALGGFILPVFFQSGDAHAGPELAAFALWSCLLLGFPILWRAYQAQRPIWRQALPVAYAAALLGGLVMLSVQIVAIPAPQLSTFITQADAEMSGAQWNRLPPGSAVLDSLPHRATTVFGRAAGAESDPDIQAQAWQALIDAPLPSSAAASGYDYIYMDREWWQQIGAGGRQALEEGCVEVVEQVTTDTRDFRRLLDISRCR